MSRDYAECWGGVVWKWCWRKCVFLWTVGETSTQAERDSSSLEACFDTVDFETSRPVCQIAVPRSVLLQDAALVKRKA
jgi:hypothetical protein